MEATRTPTSSFAPPQPAPAGVLLLQWIGENLHAITRLEAGNTNAVHLYAHGDYWHAFERSACQLARLLPEVQLGKLTFTNYPFPLVIASVPDAAVHRRLAAHKARRAGRHHIEWPAPPLSPTAYFDWLTHCPELN